MKKVVFGVMLLMSLPALLLAARQGPKIALLDSSVNTYNFFAQHYKPCEGGYDLGADEYQRYFLGWKYVLDGERFLAQDTNPDGDDDSAYDYQIIHDIDITNGTLNNKDFAILILSNTASLSDAEERAIQQWVLKGGKLIATYGSGYKDILDSDSRQTDTMKPQSGGTGGLHQLWHDPWTKAFGTQSITPEDPRSPGIDVQITNRSGPANITYPSDILSYNAEANLLVPRPENFREALAFLTFDLHMDGLGRLYPAILLTKASRGEVVYFAFAPGFIVSLAYDLAGHCSGDPNYPSNSPALTPGPDAADFPNEFFKPDGSGAHKPAPLIELMQRTIDYMRTGQ